MTTQGQVLTSDPPKVVWGHQGHQQVFADNLRLRRARDMKVVSMCLSRQYASTDMQLGLRRDLDLRSNFGLDLSRSCYICFDASWRGKHDGVKIISLSFQTQKLSLKHFKVMLYMFRCVLTRQTRWCQNHFSIISNRSYNWKTASLKNPVFDLSWPLTLKRLILGEIRRHSSEGAFQELSFAFLDLA